MYFFTMPFDIFPFFL